MTVGGCARRTVDEYPRDAASDGASVDAVIDGSSTDAGDAGALPDGGGGDAGPADTGADGGSSDAAMDSRVPVDTGPADTGAPDTGPADTGTPPTGGCISGAAGTHVVRFRWDGTTSGSTAYVRYEANTLPDTSRWRVSAASSSIGYRPVFRDPFLGDGGLELSGTVFIDVELSTLGLPAISNVTLAIYGRSYNTTTSGSFSWQTFSGTGSSPRGGVANSAPYEWYGANATVALPAGNDGTLLRIRADGPSSALIVNRVEICFDAP